MTEAQHLADEYWEFRLRTDILFALVRGELSHLEAWPDFSPAGAIAAVAEYERFVAKARAVEADSLSDRALAETIAAAASVDSVSTVAQAETMAPNLQVGLLTWLLPALTVQPLVTADHGERFLQKLAAFPGFIDQITERLRYGAASGRAPLASHVRQTITKLSEMLAAEENPFTRQPAPTHLDKAAAGRWRSALGEAVVEHVMPALRTYRDTLETVSLPAGRPDDQAGLVHLEGGVELYGRLVRAHTTLDVTPKQVHDIGLEQVERLEAEYRQLAGPLLGTDDNAEIYRRLREDPELHYHDVDRLIADATAAFRKAQAAMGEWFGRLPQADCEVRPTDVGPLAFYRPPSKDGTRPGYFFFNVSNPSSWSTFGVPAIAYHEGIPGHHLQLALGIENEEVHALHRTLYLAGFSEGWGLYTERLSDEMGLYEDDWERIGMLLADSMRACRLVVDTGLHALGWSRQQAIDYMVAHSPMAVSEVADEIDRYIALPGQATSYMMGRIAIDRLRADTEARLGDRFDIKAFHDAVLGNGMVPLSTLRTLVEERLS